VSAAASAHVAAALRSGIGAPADVAAFAARTAAFDAVVLDAVAEGFDTVVSLGAGLDDRAGRLPLPPSLCWLDIDRPEVLATRSASAVAHQPFLEALDVTDGPALADLLRRFLGRGSHRALVLSEGLLPYLTTSEVEALARVLLAAPGFARWAVSWCTPPVTAAVRALFDCHGEGFGCDDPRATFEAMGFRVVSQLPFLDPSGGLLVLEPATASPVHHAL